MAHEGSKPVRKAKINMLEGQLNRFVIFDDEIPQDMFNHIKNLSNGITVTRKQEIAFKANKKSKNKQEVVENSSEEEEEDNSECDDEDVTLF
jgi:hypothetical protein